MFFEGSEKKLELVLKPGSKALRSYGKSNWEKIVEKSRASILSEISNDKQTAYLLSESSLFITDERMLMITCGKTTLVHAALACLQMIPKEDVALLIYERKREIFPEYQRSNFFQDVKLLDEELKGCAYRFGDEYDDHIFLYHYANEFKPSPEDMTVEILMHGLDRKAAGVFESGKAHNERSIDLSGVRELIPGYEVDDFIFEPQGYSLNAIKEDKYFTIHVTPQEVGSYVSFETNHVFDLDMDATISKVLNVFKPSSCDILFFRPEASGLNIRCDFQLKKEVKQSLSGFQVSFNHYYKTQSQSCFAERLEIE